MRTWLVLGGTATVMAALAMVDCSSNDAAPTTDAGCDPDAAGIALEGPDASATCNACLQVTCPGTLTDCAADCACHDPALAALTCTNGIGAGAPTAFQTSCLEPLQSSTDLVAASMGACIETCGAACGGVAPGGACGPDAGLIDQLETDGGACQACVATSCDESVLDCLEDCSCSATAGSALSCISNLGSGATVTSINACLASLSAAGDDAGQASLALCVVESCAQACGAPSPGDDDDGDSGAVDGGGDDSSVDAGALDSGGDAAGLDGSDGDDGSDGSLGDAADDGD